MSSDQILYTRDVIFRISWSRRDQNTFVIFVHNKWSYMYITTHTARARNVYSSAFPICIPESSKSCGLDGRHALLRWNAKGLETSCP